MNNITLIHPFEVSKDKEDKFLSIWKNVDNYMKIVQKEKAAAASLNATPAVDNRFQILVLNVK